MHQQTRQLLLEGEKELVSAGVVSARRDAEDLLAFTVNMSRHELLHTKNLLTQEQVKKFYTYIERRRKREPLAYIVGFVSFYNTTIYVDPSVLIPRQETELLVDHLLSSLTNSKTLWDLCSGSGCIGLSVKKARPDLEVTLADISKEALLTSQKSAMHNHLNVRFLQGDLLASFAGQKTDCLVCNPPYISHAEAVSLEPEVAQYEPPLALYADNEGLLFYQRLAKELPSYLNPGAKVWLEIGNGQGNVVKEIFLKEEWKSLSLLQDLAGHDRFFFLEFE